jgi:thiol-disulfide isomerase/thioredoxin
MKKTVLFVLLSLMAFNMGKAQSGYDIRINFKGCKDSMVFLVKYTWDQQYLVDTCKNIKNGVIQFKGKGDLDKGVYVLVSQENSIYFDFFVNENQKFSMITDAADVVSNLKVTGNKENDLFFSYIRYITNKNKEFGQSREQTKGMNRADSTKFMNDKITKLNAEVKKYEFDFMEKNRGTYLYDVLNLKTEKEPASVPKASNGRPDSIFSYYYYRNHYWDGINFKDERIIRTPFFDDRVKRYFDNIVLQHPDTVIQEIDKVMAKCEQDNLVYNLLIGYFTYKYEQSKVMGFDKVFVHVADKYIISGKATKVYTEETTKKIKERVDILRNLLLEARVSDLYVIDTIYAKQVRRMGFDTANSSKALTDLYYKNVEQLTPMFRTLYQVNAKYTVLVFWAVDCGHCKTEVPKLHEELQKFKGNLDVKVFAVQTKDDLYDDWRRFIVSEKLKDFIHVYDPVHINNLKEKFDIYSTPVIYVLDRDKRIKAKRLGAEQVAGLIETLEAMEKNKKK